MVDLGPFLQPTHHTTTTIVHHSSPQTARNLPLTVCPSPFLRDVSWFLNHVPNQVPLPYWGMWAGWKWGGGNTRGKEAPRGRKCQGQGSARGKEIPGGPRKWEAHAVRHGKRATTWLVSSCYYFPPPLLTLFDPSPMATESEPRRSSWLIFSHNYRVRVRLGPSYTTWQGGGGGIATTPPYTSITTTMTTTIEVLPINYTYHPPALMMGPPQQWQVDPQQWCVVP